MFSLKFFPNFLVLAIFAMAVTTHAVVHSETDLKTKHHPALCRILIVSADETEVSGGSGVLFRPNEVLTAGHVPDSLRRGDSLKVQCGYKELALDKLDLRPSPSGKPYLYGGPVFSETANVIKTKNQRRLGRDVATLTLDHDLTVAPMSIYGDRGEPSLQTDQMQKLIEAGSCWVGGYGAEVYDFNKELVGGGLGFHTLKSQSLIEVPFDHNSEWSALDLLEIHLNMSVSEETDANELVKYAKSIVTHETGVGETNIEYSTAMRSFDTLSTKISLQQKSSFYAAGDSGAGIICDFKSENGDVHPRIVGVVKGIYSWPLINIQGEMVKGTMVYSERFTRIDAKSSIFID